MATDGEDRRIDEKGRVTIPQSMRESLNLEAGEEVEVVLDDGRVVVRPRISREEFVDVMEGCVNEHTRAGDADTPEPDRLKEDWTADLP